MKKLKYLLFLLVAILPVYVNALTAGLPEKISTSEGVTFYNDDTIYSAYVTDDINSLNLKLDEFSSYNIQGDSKFIINDDVTIHNIILTPQDDEEGSAVIIVPFKVIKKDNNQQSLILDNLEVVGYDINFKSTLNDYKLNVPSNVSSVYIDATVVGNVTGTEGTGIVKLNNKKTVAKVVVTNPDLGESSYTVTIVKKNYVLITAIIAILIFAVILGIIFILFKKYQDKVSTVSSDVLKKDFKELNIEKIVKENEEKKNKNTDNVSNESLTPGVLTPRTMIPEDNK